MTHRQYQVNPPALANEIGKSRNSLTKSYQGHSLLCLARRPLCHWETARSRMALTEGILPQVGNLEALLFLWAWDAHVPPPGPRGVQVAWPPEALSAPLNNACRDEQKLQVHQVSQADQDNTTRALKVYLSLDPGAPKLDKSLCAKSKPGDCLLK